jgi:hypothetical protein
MTTIYELIRAEPSVVKWQWRKYYPSSHEI